MDSTRNSEKVAGALMIALVPAIVSVAVLVFGTFDSRGESPQEIMQRTLDNLVLLDLLTVLSLVTSMLFVAAAAMVYLVFRPFGHVLPALGAVGLSMSGLVFLGMATAQRAVSAMAREFEGTSATTAEGLATAALAAKTLGAAGLTLPLMGFLLLALVVLGALFVKSGPMPRGLGWLAIAGGGLLPVGFALTVTLGGLGAMVMSAGYATFLLWLLLTGVELLRHGTREPQRAGV